MKLITTGEISGYLQTINSRPAERCSVFRNLGELVVDWITLPVWLSTFADTFLLIGQCATPTIEISYLAIGYRWTGSTVTYICSIVALFISIAHGKYISGYIKGSFKQKMV